MQKKDKKREKFQALESSKPIKKEKRQERGAGKDKVQEYLL